MKEDHIYKKIMSFKTTFLMVDEDYCNLDKLRNCPFFRRFNNEKLFCSYYGLELFSEDKKKQYLGLAKKLEICEVFQIEIKEHA